MPSEIGAQSVLFVDNFSTNGKIDASKWNFNEFSKGGSFYGNTQQRQELPSASGGVLHLRLDTFNPTGDPSHPTFYGSEAITRQLFDVSSGGVAFEAKARFAQNQPGIIGGFFTFAGPASSHDEIDFEALSNNINKIQTNIYHNEPLYEGHPQSFPLSGSLTQFHTYRIEWLPNLVRWFVDGELVRTEKTLVPDKPMAMHLNIWGPPSNWPSGDSSLVAVGSASQNKTYFFDVDYVRVEQLSTVYGSSTADSLSGTAKNDWIDGGLGGDRLVAGAGADTVIGGFGDDVLAGGRGDDTVLGAADDDRLYGGPGADVVRGGGGDDILVGGRGPDKLQGGDGADWFVYSSLADSPAGPGRDRLADFNPRWDDKIGLWRIDADTTVDGHQSFEFIGEAPFTGNAGELGYAVLPGGVLVRADVDGDQTADLEIFVAGLSALLDSDFIL